MSAVETKGQPHCIEPSSASSRSSKSNVSIAYAVTDGALVVVQRLLLSIMVLFGYDIHASHEHGRLSTLQEFIRFVRNLYYILKMIRKWLSLNYNDGIIPDPPVARRRCANAQYRSTPKNTNTSSALHVSLLKSHSPIAKCYSEPPKRYSLAQILGTKSRLRCNAAHENSDFLAQSAESTTDTASYPVFSTVMNSLLQSFTGYVQDPEVIEAGDAGAMSSGKLTNSESDVYASTREELESKAANDKQHSSITEEKSNELEQASSSGESGLESSRGEFESSGSQIEASQRKEEHKVNAEPFTATASIEFDSTGEAPVAWHLHTVPSFHCDTTEEDVDAPPVIQK